MPFAGLSGGSAVRGILKKILRYIGWTLGVIGFLVLLCGALLYVPAVQDFVRDKAVGVA